MSKTTAASLRKTIIEIDRQLLAVLVPHSTLDHSKMKKVATLEHARNAAERLLLAAEAEESRAGT